MGVEFEVRREAGESGLQSILKISEIPAILFS